MKWPAPLSAYAKLFSCIAIQTHEGPIRHLVPETHANVPRKRQLVLLRIPGEPGIYNLKEVLRHEPESDSDRMTPENPHILQKRIPRIDHGRRLNYRVGIHGEPCIAHLVLEPVEAEPKRDVPRSAKRNSECIRLAIADFLVEPVHDRSAGIFEREDRGNGKLKRYPR